MINDTRQMLGLVQLSVKIGLQREVFGDFGSHSSYWWTQECLLVELPLWYNLISVEKRCKNKNKYTEGIPVFLPTFRLCPSAGCHGNCRHLGRCQGEQSDVVSGVLPVTLHPGAGVCFSHSLEHCPETMDI